MAFSSSELAFQAEDETVVIIPKQGLPSMEMAGWKSPHLRPLRRSEVPSWFAVVSKRQERCTIISPKWLETESLRRYVDQERAHSDRFADLPYYWQITSQISLKEASDDFVGRIDDVMQLLQDSREIRLTKIRAGLLSANESHLQMTGSGALELTETTPILGQTMRTLHKFHNATTE